MLPPPMANGRPGQILREHHRTQPRLPATSRPSEPTAPKASSPEPTSRRFGAIAMSCNITAEVAGFEPAMGLSPKPASQAGAIDRTRRHLQAFWTHTLHPGDCPRLATTERFRKEPVVADFGKPRRVRVRLRFRPLVGCPSSWGGLPFDKVMCTNPQQEGKSDLAAAE